MKFLWLIIFFLSGLFAHSGEFRSSGKYPVIDAELKSKKTNAEKSMFPGFVLLEPEKILNCYNEFLYLPSVLFRFPVVEIRMNEEMKMIYPVADSLKKNEFYRDFYIKQLEVTNAEYRAFVNWTRDSIARSILANKHPEIFSTGQKLSDFPELSGLNWKTKLEYYKWIKELESMYLPETERYYRRREFDTRKIVYTCLRGEKAVSTPVYPDTNHILKELRLFSLLPDGIEIQSEYEVLWSMYFWHPAYDDFPVTGISTAQIDAYLNWKEKQLNQKFTGKLAGGKRIVLSLPSDFELELAHADVLYRSGENINTNPFNYNFDAFVSASAAIGDSLADTLYEKLKYSVYHLVELHPHFFHSCSEQFLMHRYGKGKADGYNYLTVPEDKTKIYGLSGNVSEWTSTTFSGTRKWFFELMEANIRLQIQLAPLLRTPFRPRFREGQRMIWGANFMDDRNRENTLQISQTPYTYSAENKIYSTVGFRYLIRLVDQK